jgi:F0F1-type ATP synthase assembly protein I
MLELIGKVLLGRALGRLNRRYAHVKPKTWIVVAICVAILVLFVLAGFVLPHGDYSK